MQHMSMMQNITLPSKKSRTQTQRDCEIAVMYDAALEDIPYQFRSKTVCLIALQNYTDAILSVPPDLLEELVPIAMELSNHHAIEHIPDHLLTYEMCLDAVEHDSRLIKFVPEQHRDKKLCSVAFLHDTKILEHVPEAILHDEEWLVNNLMSME